MVIDHSHRKTIETLVMLPFIKRLLLVSIKTNWKQACFIVFPLVTVSFKYDGLPSEDGSGLPLPSLKDGRTSDPLKWPVALFKGS